MSKHCISKSDSASTEDLACPNLPVVEFQHLFPVNCPLSHSEMSPSRVFFGTDSTLALARSTSVTGMVYLLEVGWAGAVSSCLWPLSRASTASTLSQKGPFHSQHK